MKVSAGSVKTRKFFMRHNPAFSSYLYIEADVCFNYVHINNELSKLN